MRLYHYPMVQRRKLFFTTCLLFLVFPFAALSQSVATKITNTLADETITSLPTEKISKISHSKKIFIISNNNNSFDKGDYITLVTKNYRVARALVAKNAEGQAGIKMLKIYSLALWKMLHPGSEVKIIRGDDSFLDKSNLTAQSESTDANESGKDDIRLKSEDDLFNETSIINDDLSFEDNKNRAIKTDNIISITLSRVKGVDLDGNSDRYNQLTGNWAYQIEDNIWLEGSYGQSLINGFPASNIDTKLVTMSFKAKYTITAPFYSYLQPFLGWQIKNADSPEAGTPGDGRTSEQLADEIELVEGLEGSGFVFGATFLKRLVPGWFIRVDLSNEILAAGFSLEF